MKKRKKQQPVVARSRTPSPPTGTGAGTRGIVRELLRGIVFALLILMVKIVIEHTDTGRRIELLGYTYLQDQLMSDAGPIQIVDISDLEVSETRLEGQTYRATSRETLLKLTQAIADQHPRAIGIDIDLSPDGNTYVTPADPEFFKAWSDMGVPVFLGIHRTHALPPEKWLLNDAYQQLAASIKIPRPDARRMPAAIQSSPDFSPGKTMSSALAAAFERARCTVGEFLQRAGLAEQMTTKELGRGGSVQEFLVDYGPLESFMNNRLKTINPDVIRDQSRLFTNKIVLVGDGTLGKGNDNFVVPGRLELAPGVYFHACAAYTLVSLPLYELNWKGRLVIDALLIAVVLLSIALVKFAFRKERPERIATGRLEFLFILIVVIAAIGVGVIFVHKTCVLWSDFILAIGALVFHPSIERRLELLAQFIKRSGPQVVRNLVLKQEPEERR